MKSIDEIITRYEQARGERDNNGSILKAYYDLLQNKINKLEDKRRYEEMRAIKEFQIDLHQIMPGATQEDIERYAKPLYDAMQEFDINTPERQEAFLAQLARESGQFSSVEENLNYTSAARIHEVFPSSLPTVASAQPYENNPEGLANRVYANRIGNGSEESGDGWRYRGRGLIQLTGRDNYDHYGDGIGVDLEANPEKAEDPVIAARAAAYYWQSNGCNELADQGNFNATTDAINRGEGEEGREEREQFYTNAQSAID